MNWAYPKILWAIAFAPFILFWGIFEIKERKKRLSRFANEAVWNHIIPELDWTSFTKKSAFLAISWVFLCIALARPQWGTHEETLKVSGLDIMIVLDVSNSMEVEDVVPNRLKKAKHVIRNIIDRMHGDRLGVIPFAGSAYVSCPLTTDLEYVYDSVEILNTKTIVNQGTDLGIALDTAYRAMERGSEETQRPGDTTQKASRAILLISDGEDHEEGALDSAKKLAQAGIRLYVMGVGTAKGGPIPVRDETGQLRGYKRTRAGENVISTFRGEALMKVASAGQGRYWTLSPDEGEVDEFLKDMGALTRSDFAERRFVVYEDRFQIPLFFAVLFLILELFVPARKILSSTAKMMLAYTLFSLFGTPAEAVPIQSYFENKQGLEAFEKGDVSAAKQHFGNAQSRDPESPEFRFNQGVVQMQEQQVEQAVSAFDSAAQGARKNNNPRLEGRSRFNQAQALTQKGEMEPAIKSYLEAIRAAQRAKDLELEMDARKNIELLARQQQQNQKKSGESSESDKKQDGSESDQNKDKKDSKQKKESDAKKKEEEQKQAEEKKKKENAKKMEENQQAMEQPKRKEFKSLKLSKEDAERVMAELSNKEKELQKKLSKQRVSQQPNEKDW